MDYLADVGLDEVWAHEQDLITYALDALVTVPGLRVLGPADPATRGAATRSPSKTCTRTTPARCWTSTAWPSAPGTTAPAAALLLWY